MHLRDVKGRHTLTETGERFGVSRKTVRRCIDEVQAFLDNNGEGSVLTTENGESFTVIDVDSPVCDSIPFWGYINGDQGNTVYMPTAELMDANPVLSASIAMPVVDVEKTTDTVTFGKKYYGAAVGDRVMITEGSPYYNLEDLSNPAGVVGTVSGRKNQTIIHDRLTVIVSWDNGTENIYQDSDLELYVAGDIAEDIAEDTGVDYFVVAPQDSVSIVRVDKESGEVINRNVNKHSGGFAEIRAMIVASQDKLTLQRAFTLMDTRASIAAFSVGRVRVDAEGDSVVFIKADGSERAVPQDLCDDIITTVQTYGRESGDCGKLIKFLDNLMDNVSFKSIQDLYRFLKNECITINDDGTIAAWKGVQQDLYSSMKGAIKSSPTVEVNQNGQIYNGNFGHEIRVDRSEVDDDSDASCSNGLHVGSLHYASGWATTLLAVSVQPKDVVAVPRYSDGAKMRTCAYIPLGIQQK
jgi:hypothetical protein